MRAMAPAGYRGKRRVFHGLDGIWDVLKDEGEHILSLGEHFECWHPMFLGLKF